MARLLRTRQAESDILDIWERIASENSKAADKLIRKLDAAMRGLSKQPGIGSSQDKYRVGLGCFPVGKYFDFL